MEKGKPEAPPCSSMDDVIDAYKKNVDRTLLIENLKLTPSQRLENLISTLKALEEWRAAGKGLTVAAGRKPRPG